MVSANLGLDATECIQFWMWDRTRKVQPSNLCKRVPIDDRQGESTQFDLQVPSPMEVMENRNRNEDACASSQDRWAEGGRIFFLVRLCTELERMPDLKNRREQRSLPPY